MPEPRYHKSLRLQNFTVFKDVEFDFVDGINAFIGENGSGKTHLLKIMYACHLGNFNNYQRYYWDHVTDAITGVFQIRHAGMLFRNGEKNAKYAKVNGLYGDHDWQLKFRDLASRIDFEDPYTFYDQIQITRPLYIPSIDMMGHTRRFVATYDEYNIDFDLTHRNIVSLLLSPEKRSNSDQHEVIQNIILEKIGGEVHEENERFYLETPEGRQPMPLVAEGLRKLATLYQLIKNGFLQPGTTLFWDEPEVNLNPTLMDELVQILLELSRQGVQIFLTTHSYFILKELEVQSRKSDALKFFALEQVGDETKVHSAKRYLDLSPNLIEQQSLSLYDRSIRKRLSGGGE